MRCVCHRAIDWEHSRVTGLASTAYGSTTRGESASAGVPPRRINEIVHGKRAITADTALRLGRYFGVEPQFWLNLQTRYDLELADGRIADQIS